MQILFFSCLNQCFRVVRLHTEKVVYKVCLTEPPSEFGHYRRFVAEIHGNFAILGGSIANISLKLMNSLQQSYCLSWITDEIVIHNEDVTSPTKLEQFPERILCVFPWSHARLSAKACCYITELATKRTSPGDLHRHSHVVI